MKHLLLLIVGTLRSIADGLEKRQEKEDGYFDLGIEVGIIPDVDIMADVDDQRAHHFGDPKVLDD